MNAILTFTSNGDLILRYANGTLAWSTNTSGKSVVGMKISSAFIEANPPRVYMKLFHEDYLFYPLKIGSLDYFENEYNDPYAVAYESETKLFQYMRLEWDGHMRIYEWVEGIEAIVDDVPASRLRTVLIP